MPLVTDFITVLLHCAAFSLLIIAIKNNDLISHKFPFINGAGFSGGITGICGLH
jgi:hypothetical protein